VLCVCVCVCALWFVRWPPQNPPRTTSSGPSTVFGVVWVWFWGCFVGVKDNGQLRGGSQPCCFPHDGYDCGNPCNRACVCATRHAVRACTWQTTPHLSISPSLASKRLVVPEGMSLCAVSLWLLPRLVARELLSPDEASLLKIVALRGDTVLLAPFELFVHENREMTAGTAPAVSAAALEGMQSPVDSSVMALVESLKLLYADYRMRLSDTGEVVQSTTPGPRLVRVP
jgi:hypothetical protein